MIKARGNIVFLKWRDYISQVAYVWYGNKSSILFKYIFGKYNVSNKIKAVN